MTLSDIEPRLYKAQEREAALHDLLSSSMTSPSAAHLEVVSLFLKTEPPEELAATALACAAPLAAYGGVDMLEAHVDHASAAIRAGVADAVARHVERNHPWAARAFALIDTLLTDREHDVRESAAYGLWRITDLVGDAESWRRLVALAEGGDSAVAPIARRVLIESLLSLDGDAPDVGRAYVAGWLESDDGWLRCAAITAWGTFSQPAEVTLREMLDGADEATTVALVEVAARWGMMSLLRDLCEHHAAEVRQALSTSTATWLGARDGFALLARLSRDAEPDVRADAFAAMHAYADEPKVRAHLKAHATREHDVEVIVAIVGALAGCLGDRELAVFVDHPSAEVRRALAATLPASKPSDEVLGRILSDAAEEVCRAAAAALDEQQKGRFSRRIAEIVAPPPIPTLLLDKPVDLIASLGAWAVDPDALAHEWSAGEAGETAESAASDAIRHAKLRFAAVHPWAYRGRRSIIAELLDVPRQELVANVRSGYAASSIKTMLEELDIHALAYIIESDVQWVSGMRERAQMQRRLALLRTFIDQGVRPAWLVLDAVPVMPPRLRPDPQSRLNVAYAALKAAKSSADPRAIQRAVDALYAW